VVAAPGGKEGVVGVVVWVVAGASVATGIVVLTVIVPVGGIDGSTDWAVLGLGPCWAGAVDVDCAVAGVVTGGCTVAVDAVGTVAGVVTGG
jgi:hypothetical protein